MNPELRNMLLAADHATGCECPGEFPENVSADMEAIWQLLAERYGPEFERDGCVQDASFHDEIRVLTPAECERRKRTGCYAHVREFAIRFSNFGRLFTICSDFDPAPERFDAMSIIKLVEQFGWHYVPADELNAPYDGINPTLRNAGITWWIRFFDYL